MFSGISRLRLDSPFFSSVRKSYRMVFWLTHADADFVGDSAASKSTSGYVIHADRILVLWKPKKQGLVSRAIDYGRRTCFYH